MQMGIRASYRTARRRSARQLHVAAQVRKGQHRPRFRILREGRRNRFEYLITLTSYRRVDIIDLQARQLAG